MASEVLKGALKGINEGINKSPFPNPVGQVAGGINNVRSGFKGFQKRQDAFNKKQQSVINKKNRLEAREKLQQQKLAANQLKAKQAQGKEYLAKLKAKLEGQKTPSLAPQAGTFTPAHGVAGSANYVPKQPNVPRIRISKKMLTKQ